MKGISDVQNPLFLNGFHYHKTGLCVAQSSPFKTVNDRLIHSGNAFSFMVADFNGCLRMPKNVNEKDASFLGICIP
uniref:Uncharacterized protein n=1 Tax=Steinernema glaseri TaxID=37863 RepID=A0A1I8A657_9BILA